jgi:hypothetical protein
VWYELPSFYVFHIANAWEEGGKVKMVACQAERVDLNAMKFSEDMGENCGVNLAVIASVCWCNRGEGLQHAWQCYNDACTAVRTLSIQPA